MIVVFIPVIITILALVYIAVKGQLPKQTEEARKYAPGEQGENEIAQALACQIDKGLSGTVLRNLYIPKDDARTTEIDVLLISTKGIFVIESKDFAGYIFGNDSQKYWTVSLNAGRGITEKHRFYNPVWQNKTHIRYLRRFIESSIPIYSVVVFSDRSEFKDISCYTDEVSIMQFCSFDRYFSTVRTVWPDCISEDQLEEIGIRLSSFTQADEEQRQKHIHQILEEKYNPQICPWCGGRLVERTAKRGANIGQKFYGCSNYPKCHYTRSL